MAVTLAPYIRGRGPRLKIDIDNGKMIAYEPANPRSGEKAKRTVVFSWDPYDYRPGLGANTEVRQAEDLLGFVLAYVERPEEFNRSRRDPEQRNRHWWNQYGETMLYAVHDS